MITLEDNIKFIHVFAIAILFAALPAGILIRRAAKRFPDIETKMLSALAPLGPVLAGSSIVVLLTGGYMSGANWFNFDGGHGWLAIKQLLFFTGFAVGLIILKRMGKTLATMIDNIDAIDKIRAYSSKMMIVEHTLSAIVVINMYMAVVKPF